MNNSKCPWQCAIKRHLRPRVFGAAAFGLVVFGFAVSNHAGESTYPIAPPRGQSPTPNAAMTRLTIVLPNPAGGNINVTVPRAGQPALTPWNWPAESFAQASARKAAAIKDAIDNDPAAQAAGMTATPMVVTSRGIIGYNGRVPIIGDIPQYTKITYGGVRAAVGYAPDPTFEAGGRGNFQQGGGGSSGSQPSYTPSMGRPSGSSPGSSSGTGLRDSMGTPMSSDFSNPSNPLDASGVVVFGYYDFTGSSVETVTPGTDFVTGLQTLVGQTEEQILQELVTQWNTQFQASSGNMAIYDPVTVSIGLLNPLDNSHAFMMFNTDDGLNLQATITPVPEPSGVVLGAVAAMGFVTWRLTKRRNG